MFNDLCEFRVSIQVCGGRKKYGVDLVEVRLEGITRAGIWVWLVFGEGTESGRRSILGLLVRVKIRLRTLLTQ